MILLFPLNIINIVINGKRMILISKILKCLKLIEIIENIELNIWKDVFNSYLSQ